MPEQPDLPRPQQTPQKQPGIHPGQGAPEIPRQPDQEMPTRRGRPGRDIPNYPEKPSHEMPDRPGRVEQPEVPGVPQKQPQDQPPMIGMAD